MAIYILCLLRCLQQRCEGPMVSPSPQGRHLKLNKIVTCPRHKARRWRSKHFIPYPANSILRGPFHRAINHNHLKFQVPGDIVIHCIILKLPHRGIFSPRCQEPALKHYRCITQYFIWCLASSKPPKFRLQKWRNARTSKSMQKKRNNSLLPLKALFI